MNIRRSLAIATSTCLAVVGLAACGGGGQTSDRADGDVSLALEGDLTVIDPSRSASGPDLAVYSQVYESLLKLNPETNELEPELATSYKLINPTTWEFKLREGVKFTNGEPFDASSVIASIKRYQGDGSSSLTSVSGISSVTAPDPQTVRITSKQPNADLPRNMQGTGAAGTIFMFPAKYVQESSDEKLGEAPVGTGPYQLAEWNRGQSLTLEQNPDYWGEKPEVKKATFRFIAETSTRVDALRSGEIDIAFGLPYADADAIDKAQGTHVESTKNGTVLTMLVDMNKPPFDDIRVRKAFAMAIPTEEITKSLLDGRATPLGTPLAPSVEVAAKDQDPYPYDPEQAKQLMQEAGYSASKPLELETKTSKGRYPSDSEVYQAINNSLGEAGFKITPTPSEWSRLSAQMADGNGGPFYLIGFSYGAGLASKMNLFALSSSSYQMVNVPEFDRLAQRAVTETDPAQNAETWKQAQKALYDAYALPAQWQLESLIGQSDRVQWTPRSGSEIDLETVSFS